MTETCETCKYFRPDPEPKSWSKDDGVCHRYPPSMDGSRTPVNKAMDCGEWFPNAAESRKRMDEDLMRITGQIPPWVKVVD